MTLQKWGAFLESVGRRFDPDGAYSFQSAGDCFAGSSFYGFSLWQRPRGGYLVKPVIRGTLFALVKHPTRPK